VGYNFAVDIMGLSLFI